MFKKVIAIAMAAVMAFTVVPAMNVSAASEATPTDLSRISKKPVLAYTFEGQDKELELKGTAKVENGVLNLTPKAVADEAGSTAGYGENYAKIGSLAGYDFSKGFSLVFDLNFSAFTNEWTSPIVLGNGSIENRGTLKGQVGYHFNSGMSNVMDIGKSATSGTDNDKYGVYGGGQIANPLYDPNGVYEGYAPLAAPYTYDWFQYAENHNKWYSFVVTISNTGDLKMYINGALVQDCPDDGQGSVKKIFDNVNNFTNNLLGATYWGPLGTDIDFQGKMDNVAFYNEVLTAEDAQALTTAVKEDTNKVLDSSNKQQAMVSKSEYKTCSIMDYEVEAGKKKIECYLSANASKVDVSVTVNGKNAKSIKKSGKTFVATLSKALKKGDKVVITVKGAGYFTVTKKITVKGIYKLSKVKVKKGATKVTGKVSAKGAKVQVKVGKKAYKKAKVKGKSFTFKCASLKKGTTVKVKVSGKNYKTLTKSYKVK